MSMDLALLRDTLEHALSVEEDFPRLFYATLLSRHPDLRALFQRNSPGAQQKMFAQKLTAVVDNLDDPDWAKRELSALAHSHAGYGVTEEMYPWVGEALIDALRVSCGAAWSSEAEHAWRQAYVAITQAVLAVPVKAVPTAP